MSGITFGEMYRFCLSEVERRDVWLRTSTRPDPGRVREKLICERMMLVFDLIADDETLQNRLALLRRQKEEAQRADPEPKDEGTPAASSVPPEAGRKHA